jgi:hypothetical protein
MAALRRFFSRRQGAASFKGMRSPRNFLTLIQAGVAVASLLAPQLGFAYDHPLRDDAVREAYFLGQNPDQAAQLLSRYVQSLPVPESGPHVAQIELSTPYAQVVEVSQQHSVGYSAQDAAADYKKRGDFILVRVQVMFTPSYSDRGEGFWRDVSVGLVQKDHMAARSVSAELLYSGDRDGDSWIIGANVFVVFSVAGVESDSVQVEVVPPEGETVRATFDLDGLR